MFVLPKTLSHIVCHPFKIMKNINQSIPSIQNIRNIQKRKVIWDEQMKWFNLKSQIQNKIGFSYQGVGLI
jgi:hypothetical protein